MKTMLIVAATLLFVCTSVAQDASKAKANDSGQNSASALNTEEKIDHVAVARAAAAEAKAKADQEAAAKATKLSSSEQQTKPPTTPTEKIDAVKTVKKTTPKK